MKIRIDPHTLERAEERGASKEEILDVLKNGTDIQAKYDRLAKIKTYDFQAKRNGKYYAQKQIQVYYVIENGYIITVTVYVFYGKWEEKE